MKAFFDSVLEFFFAILDFFHTILEPIFGVHSWGWSIIALTLLVRVLLLPLAIKQTRSMRAMQAIQPQIKELQKKYKVDRELMRKDPETYRARRQKLSEEQMALFKREGANPAASCLPLLAQAPIFIALFWTLQREASDTLLGQPFYFFTRYVDEGLVGSAGDAGWPGWLLILLMSGSMFITSRQMMARNAAMTGGDAMSQQVQMQKMLMYGMPIFLAVISFRFPLGILLYWVTTNIWQIGQQWIILREVQHEVETGELANKPGGEAAKRTKKKKGGPGQDAKPTRRSPGASSGRTPIEPGDQAGDSTASAENGPPKSGKSGKSERSDKPGPSDGGSAKKGDRSNGSGPSGKGSGRGESSGGKGRTGKSSKRDHLPQRRGGASS